MTLKFWGSMVKYFLDCPSIGKNCIMFFSRLVGLCVFEKTIKHNSHHIVLSTWLFTVAINLDHLAEVVSCTASRSLHYKVTSPAFHKYSVFFGRKSPCSSNTWRSVELGCTSLRGEHLHEIFGILPHLFVDLIIYLYQYRLMDINL